MEFRAAIRKAASHVRRAVLVPVGRVLRGLLSLLLALILLFEEWGWRPLAELLGLLARFKPWARVEVWIAGLPPYAALLVFVLPTTILLPIKLGALFLLSQGKVLMAAAFLLLAKMAGTALVARIFLLTRPALMQLPWFARLYNWLIPWKEAIFARVRASWAWRYGRMLKRWGQHEARRAWMRWQPRLSEYIAGWRSWMVALVARVRRAGMRFLQRLRTMFGG